MHILFSVHYNSHRNGLIENVFSTVKYCLRSGYKTTVICREGAFADRLINSGSKVITTDYEEIKDTVEKVILSEGNFDVIHTHPGPSRKVALEVSEKLNIPIIMTFHGMWYDSLGRYSDRLSAIFTVSEGVKDFLRSKLDKNSDKFVIVPNGVDKSIFRPKNKLMKINKKNRVLNIALITRLDKDKDFIIQLFYKALKYTSKEHTKIVKWTVVGDGTELKLLREKVKEITKGEQPVDFVGWQTGKELSRYYNMSDIVIAPGRCALEAMSCGKPVIAIGSKKYNGLVTKENWHQGVYTNFGGFGNKMDDYIEGSIEEDLEKVINDEDLRNNLSKLGITITNLFYNEDEINKKIVGIYNIIK